MNYRQPFKGSWPITQRFGETYTDPKGHTGIDYACPLGTPVLASADGYVIETVTSSTGYGIHIKIRHSDGNVTLYAHLSTILVKVWQKVSQGEIIGRSGSTGNSTGPHLHFEMRRIDGVPIDPMPVLMSVDDAVPEPEPPKCDLKTADQLGADVEIVAPAGAWAWSPNFDKRQTVYPCGTKLHFTGKTVKRNEYTYCEVYPEPSKYWVAVHDNDTQILDNSV